MKVCQNRQRACSKSNGKAVLCVLVILCGAALHNNHAVTLCSMIIRQHFHYKHARLIIMIISEITYNDSVKLSPTTENISCIFPAFVCWIVHMLLSYEQTEAQP